MSKRSATTTHPFALNRADAQRSEQTVFAAEAFNETPALKILNPAQRAEFLLTGEPNGDRLRLETSLDRRTPLHWYLNDAYLGQSAPDRPLQLRLTAGHHTLACVAADGATARVEFQAVEP